jgi:hypothetical protein
MNRSTLDMDNASRGVAGNLLPIIIASKSLIYKTKFQQNNITIFYKEYELNANPFAKKKYLAHFPHHYNI